MNSTDRWLIRFHRRTTERGRVVPASVTETGKIATPEGQELAGISIARRANSGAPVQAVIWPGGVVVWNA
jgi:hypothetical protein